MKCEDFRNNIADLFDDDRNSSRMEQHIKQCKDCNTYYRQTVSTIDVITPKVEIKADGSLRENILDACRESKGNDKSKLKKRIYWGTRIAASIGAVAIIILSVVNLTNGANAAGKLLDKSIEGTNNLQSMVMKLNVRTLPQDNFALIDLTADLVPHTISVILGDQKCWRIDKGGRATTFDGEKQYMWVSSNGAAYFGDKNVNFAEWFCLFLDPQMVFLTEKNAIKEKNTKHTIDTNDTEIRLTITTKAKGNFKNNYLLNSSIEESDNVREYIFDKKTNLMKSLKIYVLIAGTEVLVLETTDIQYNTPISKNMLTIRPENLAWKNMNDLSIYKNSNHASLLPEEVAGTAFYALCSGNVDSCDFFISFNKTTKENLNTTYQGAKLIRLGKAFTSGNGSGYFIPYEILMPTGKVKKHNIALRNDNKNKTWQVDGGI